VRLKVRTNSGVKVPVGQKHWMSEAEGNCVVERRGGGQPEANNQSIINKNDELDTARCIGEHAED
jgi:hypothetical protein